MVSGAIHVNAEEDMAKMYINIYFCLSWYTSMNKNRQMWRVKNNSTTTTTLTETMANSKLEQQSIHGNHRSITISKKDDQQNAPETKALWLFSLNVKYMLMNVIWFKSELRVNFHVKSKCECKWQTPENYYILMFEMKHRVEMRWHTHIGKNAGKKEEEWVR